MSFIINFDMFSMFGDQSMRDYFSEIDDCDDLMLELYYKFSHEFFDIVISLIPYE